MEKRRYQAFVSSTYEDLKEERKEITQALLECNCFPAGMELFPASTKSQWEVIKRVIDGSDFYIVIIAGRYGSIGSDETGKKVSYTEMEFDYALKKDKPIIALLYDGIEDLPKSKTENTTTRHSKLLKFRNKACAGRIIKKWTNKDNLKSAAFAAINALIQDEDNGLRGWIPFEKEIEERGNELETAKREINGKISELQSIQKELNSEKEKNDDISKKNQQLIDYVDKLEHYVLESGIAPDSLEDVSLKESVEKKVKDKLLKKISQYEDEFIFNFCVNVNQDEPLFASDVPEAKEYAIENLLPKEKEYAKKFGLV